MDIPGFKHIGNFLENVTTQQSIYQRCLLEADCYIGWMILFTNIGLYVPITDILISTCS